MTIPRLAGIGDELKETLPQFGEAIKGLINPNWKLQANLKEALASNPEMVQQLADISARNPGILQMLGYGSLGDQISQIPESSNSKNTRMIEGEVSRQLQNPTNLQNVARSKAGINKAEGEVADTEYKKAATNATNFETEFKQKQAEYQINARKRFAEIANERGGIPGIVNGILSGSMPASDIDAIFNTESAKAVQLALQDRWNMLDYNARMAAARNDPSASNAQTQAQAVKLLMDTGMGDVNGYMALISNPQASQLAQQLIQNPALISQEPDLQKRAMYDGLVRSYIGMQRLESDRQAADLDKAYKGFLAATTAFGKAKDRKAAAIAVQNALTQISNLGGPKITVNVDDPWYRGAKLEFTSGGTKLSEEDVSRLIVPQQSSDWVGMKAAWDNKTPYNPGINAIVSETVKGLKAGKITKDQVLSSDLTPLEKELVLKQAGQK